MKPKKLLENPPKKGGYNRTNEFAWITHEYYFGQLAQKWKSTSDIAVKEVWVVIPSFELK